MATEWALAEAALFRSASAAHAGAERARNACAAPADPKKTTKVVGAWAGAVLCIAHPVPRAKVSQYW